MPSAAPSLPISTDPSRTQTPTGSKAAGKQPMRDPPSKSALDTKSEELFPSLGAPKAAPQAAPSMWYVQTLANLRRKAIKPVVLDLVADMDTTGPASPLPSARPRMA